MDTRAYLEERLPPVERAIDAALPPADAPPQSLHAAMRHVLFPGGKRLRPALALAAAEAVGASPERALPVAVAVELVHTYSLIHDDLPCMDDDAERRGRPAVHVAFGEATAVLAGDALLTAAFEVLLDGATPETAAQRLAAARELALAAGSRGLVGGQVDDLRFDPADRSVAHIESVHARKSGALIAASILGGAHLGGADAASLERLRRCGRCVGVAFQIADDVLDAGEDDPCSLVRALGVEAARERSERLLKDALDALGEFGERAEPLRALVRFAVRRRE
ncbi:MAG: polyprenyl synthetase family protein [Myxococcales bacterium]|nr:polyprenyl synthetase family protein [Myxococcales bacterium]MDH5307199.1 polyprenyl synthetase family protein [Myxococcales bacterium]